MTKNIFVSEVMNKDFDMQLISSKYIPEFSKVLDTFKSLYGIADDDCLNVIPQKQMDMKYVGKSLNEE